MKVVSIIPRVRGAATAPREELGIPPEPTDHDEIDRQLVARREAMPEEELAAALAAGQAMEWEQAIAYALGETEPS